MRAKMFDERVGGGVMCEGAVGFQFGQDLFGENFAKFDAPLIE